MVDRGTSSPKGAGVPPHDEARSPVPARRAKRPAAKAGRAKPSRPKSLHAVLSKYIGIIKDAPPEASQNVDYHLYGGKKRVAGELPPARGVVANGKVILANPRALPDGTPVHVGPQPGSPRPPRFRAPAAARRGKTLYESLKPFIGCLNHLPEDASEQVDHYLYGTPKAP